MSWDSTLKGQTLIEARGLGKRYGRSYSSSQQRLARAFLRTLFFLPREPAGKDKADEFWSLQNINFTVERGRALAVIGLNGAGKTTLLKILSGQLIPDEGEVTLRGQISSMIDLTAGFQDSMSGRENIYVRGAMLGFSHAALRAIEADIIEFSELGEFIDSPLGAYSAGMRMRLAFAISVFVDPQILIIDEVLAVGDIRFHSKCLAKIRKFRENAAIVLVTHSMDDAVMFADEVIVLEKGRMVFRGDPKEAVAYYQASRAVQEFGAVEDDYQLSFSGEEIVREDAIADVSHVWLDENGREVDQIMSRRPATLRIRFRLLTDKPPRNLIVGVPFWTASGSLLTGMSTEVHPLKDIDVRVNEMITVDLNIQDVLFNPGTYYSMVTVLDGSEFFYRRKHKPLKVTQNDPRYWGDVSLPYYWRATHENEHKVEYKAVADRA